MTNSDGNASILVYVPRTVKHAVRIAAAMENTGMSAYIAGLVTEDLAKKKLLSESTTAAPDVPARS